MCVIIACPPNNTPTRRMLEMAVKTNPDGAGYMFSVHGELVIDKSATETDRIIQQFLELRNKWPQVWCAFHARIATHGSVNDENTHPFIVPGQDWAVMHNGIMGLKDGPWSDRSDSRIFAEDHVSYMTWQQMRDSIKDVESWLAGDKVVILSAHKEKGGRCMIMNQSLGRWDTKDGCWYSHPIYDYSPLHQSKYWGYYGNGYGGKWEPAPKTVTPKDAEATESESETVPLFSDSLIASAATLLAISEDDIRAMIKDPNAANDILEMMDEDELETIEATPDIDIIPGHWDNASGLYVADDGSLWTKSPDSDNDLIIPFHQCSDCHKALDECDCPFESIKDSEQVIAYME